MKLKPNNILIIVATLIVLAGVYWYFFTGTGNEPPLSAGAAPSDAQAKFETLVSQLPISFDTSIFNDARFNALVDITKPVAPEPVGRTDPLAPIPGITGTR